MQTNRDTRVPARAPAPPVAGGERSSTMQSLRGMDFAAQEAALTPSVPSGPPGQPVGSNPGDRPAIQPPAPPAPGSPFESGPVGRKLEAPDYTKPVPEDISGGGDERPSGVHRVGDDVLEPSGKLPDLSPPDYTNMPSWLDKTISEKSVAAETKANATQLRIDEIDAQLGAGGANKETQSWLQRERDHLAKRVVTERKEVLQAKEDLSIVRNPGAQPKEIAELDAIYRHTGERKAAPSMPKFETKFDHEGPRGSVTETLELGTDKKRETKTGVAWTPSKGATVSRGTTTTNANKDKDLHAATTETTSAVSGSAKSIDDAKGHGMATELGYNGTSKKEKESAPVMGVDGKPTNLGGTTGGTLGFKSALTNKVQVLVERVMPPTDPPTARVTITVNFGVSLGGNADGERADGNGTKATAGASASLKGNIVGSFGMIIDEKNVPMFLNSVDDSASGITGRAGQIIGLGRAGDWVAAARAYMGTSTQLGDAEMAKQIPEGQSMDLEMSGEAGAEVNAGVEGGGFGVGVKAGGKVGGSIKFGAIKKNGKMVITATVADSVSGTLGASAKAGIFGASAAKTAGHDTGVSYVFTLDPAQGNYGNLYSTLRSIKTQQGLRDFAAAHGDLVGEHTETTKDSDGGSFGLSAFGEDGLNLGVESGSSRQQKKTYDKDGNVTGQENEGSNTQSMKLSLLGIEYKRSSTETATTMKVDNETALDVHQDDEETDLANTLINKVDKKLGGTGKELKEADKNSSGMVLNQRDIRGLISIACSDDASLWANHTPSPEVSIDWMKLRETLRAKFLNKTRNPDPVLDKAEDEKDAQEAANLISDFVGTDGGGRDDVIYNTVNGDGRQGGQKYELPEDLAALKPELIAMTVGNPLSAVAAFAADRDAVLARPFKDMAADSQNIQDLAYLDQQVPSHLLVIKDVLERCGSLYARINTAAASDIARFEKGGSLVAMLDAISKRQNEAERLKLKITGKSEAQVEIGDALNRYNAALGSCMTAKRKADAIFSAIASIVGDDDHCSNSGDSGDAQAQFNQLKMLYALWRPDYGTVTGIYADNNIGTPSTFTQFAPDEARYQAACALKNPNSPAVAAESDAAAAKRLAKFGDVDAGPKQARVKEKKKPSYVQSYDPVKEQKAHDEGYKNQSLGVFAQMRQAKASAEAGRNHLQCWMVTEARAGASDLYERGKKVTASADGKAVRVKEGDVVSLGAEGVVATQEYTTAAELYREGLALYPAGWPQPKK